jgi:hypothetical protein
MVLTKKQIFKSEYSVNNQIINEKNESKKPNTAQNKSLNIK